MNIDEIYSLVKYACAKNQQGYINPASFNLVINQAQESYIDYLLGEYQKYQIRRPIAVVAFGENERVRTSISPLIYEEIIPVNSTTGIADYPYGFLQVDAMWSQYGFYNIRFTEQDRLQSNYRSVIDPVTSNPVYLLKHDGIQFYPETVGNAKLSFVKNPPAMNWGYTEDANGLPVYSASISTQPVWSDTDLLNIISRALAIFGVNLQFGTVQQYANDIKNSGQ